MDALVTRYAAHHGGQAGQSPGSPLAAVATSLAKRTHLAGRAAEIVVGLDANAEAGEGLGMQDGVWERHVQGLLEFFSAARDSACGRVVDADTASPVAGARVTLRAPGERARRVVSTSASGHFCAFTGASPSCWEVSKVFKKGYASLRQPRDGRERGAECERAQAVHYLAPEDPEAANF